MNYSQVKVIGLFTVLVFVFNIGFIKADVEYNIDSDGFSPNFHGLEIVTLQQRRKRDVVPASTSSIPPSGAPAVTNASSSTPTPGTKAASPPALTDAEPTHSTSDDINRTTALTKTNPVATVTQTPLLGYNGTGIWKTNTTNMPKVSDPILPDDNFTNVFETPEKIKAEQNLSNLTYDHHIYYNSTFINNKTYFDEHWANITKSLEDIHPVLSNSHRRATVRKLKFKFPFYGHMLTNITIATGGFIFTGDQIHTWLAATQYIAPLMANFDTTMTNESIVKLYDDGEKFTTLWENVTLQEDVHKNFTFAVTLYKNGDIVFAYKHVPIPIANITDKDHPVKVGISDAYLTHNYVFYVRQKTIFEYHRVSFNKYEITDNTILKLIALPTCPLYESCNACINHMTNFHCKWCEQIKRCSNGIDRNKQDWTLRHCDKLHLKTVNECAKVTDENKTSAENTNTYVTDGHNNPQDVPVLNTTAVDVTSNPARAPPHPDMKGSMDTQTSQPVPNAGSSVGGAVVAVTVVTLIFALIAWTIYAFKNPHTRSGQMLIKYRPSQWSWRRGEARYTAATIHM